ncbi:hypothetical protein [Microvirga calopogonii]|uniref:hypothetical protein n=1 Tax=Microvirga calopogonii TaxID=2078013 RepID=UPI000E0D2241|nr:hypothetical protein [Microvirga calopogonii]
MPLTRRTHSKIGYRFHRWIALTLLCFSMMAGAVSAQTNRTLSASELETARLGIYLRLAVERCGYKLRYNPIKSIYPGASLWDVVSSESKKLLTDITLQEMSKFVAAARPGACSAAWDDYGPQKRKGIWALMAADEPEPPGRHPSLASQYSFIACKDLKDFQTYLGLANDKAALIDYLERSYKNGSCERIAAGTEISIDRRQDGGKHRYACYRVPGHRECVWGPDLFR